MKKSGLKVIGIFLTVIILVSLVPMSVLAKNTEGAKIIEEVRILDVCTPYIGETPDYDVRFGDSKSYRFDDQLEGDHDVIDGKWWYDETDKKVVSPTDTFIEDHVYSFDVLLKVNDDYEFQVDDENKPIFEAYINTKKATVTERLTTRFQTNIKYTFEPCSYNPEVLSVEINVEEPVAGAHPEFEAEVLTNGVATDKMDSPYYIEGVAWYDCVNQTFLDPYHTFDEDGVYEANVAIKTTDDFYFAYEVAATVNGKKAETGGSGKDGKYHLLVSCVVYGDAREEVSYVEIDGVTEPVERLFNTKFSFPTPFYK